MSRPRLALITVRTAGELAHESPEASGAITNPCSNAMCQAAARFRALVVSETSPRYRSGDRPPSDQRRYARIRRVFGRTFNWTDALAVRPSPRSTIRRSRPPAARSCSAERAARLRPGLPFQARAGGGLSFQRPDSVGGSTVTSLFRLLPGQSRRRRRRHGRVRREQRCRAGASALRAAQSASNRRGRS